ncbi:alpha/beta hydrolase family domain-containing protein [Rhizoctonia solani AG-1 IA]|uniref:Alpha/beta hydrolase family domain-containing protein n=1 Tax=Thanatephorus cucumeris (strain AG1-IA) TaxID=983506 RepID=L8X7B3_THACA|nr:alpha/beta hydrolase family domain-containing protein [Rhizoctonia solani AG-1 IA]
MPFIKVSSGTQIHYQIPSCPNRVNPTLDQSKPVVLLLHPRFFDLHFFAPQYRDARLAKGYNLVGLNHHYHGETKSSIDTKPYDFWKIAKDILQVLDTLKVKKAYIFGNSLGGPIAVRMHMLQPERVAALILCAKHPPVEVSEVLQHPEFSAIPTRLSVNDLPIHLGMHVMSPQTTGLIIFHQTLCVSSHALMYIYFGEDPTAQSLVDEWVATSKFRPSNRKLITKIFSSLLDREPVEPRLWKTITCPVLILHGEKDVPYPPEVAHDHYAALPNAERELHIIPDAPHFLSWTHPAIVNELTANFLDRVTGVDSRRAATMPIARDATTPTQRDYPPFSSLDGEPLIPGQPKKRGFLARVGLKSN